MAVRDVLEALSAGTLDVDRALEELRLEPFRDMGFANVDAHRAQRQGVIFGEGKTAAQIIGVGRALLDAGQNVLVTRVRAEHAADICGAFDAAVHHDVARIIRIEPHPIAQRTDAGVAAVVTGGTSDIPVAEEACQTLEALGVRVDRLFDVGVAGIHRLLHRAERLRSASAVIAIAGMEGALPSVVGGIVSAPVIAVPTSIGYGTALGGFTPLLAMLTSCASGITVVNIDNGFGAALAVHRILAASEKARKAAT
jgi:NCAIR mutase (PurE)-related protein